MTKSIVISERDNIAAVIENDKVSEFFVTKGDILLNDVYLAKVENILPSIEAAFVNVGSDKMGFLHASDVTGKGRLEEKLKPGQKILVQVIKEPTGHKGPRVTMSLSLPGRFLVLMPDETGINVSKKIESSKERARLKSIVSLLKPAGVGIIIRTEAEGQSESEIQDDIETLLEKWNDIVNAVDTHVPPTLVSRDQDLLYRVIREACSEDTDEIIVDTSFAAHRTNQLLQSWNMNHDIKVSVHKGTDNLLVNKGIDKEIKNALQTKVNMPSGGYLFIQQTEALTVIDVNSGKFTTGANQAETIRKTNLEAIDEIARQMKLRNIGGMIIIDFIDMDNRADKLTILEHFEAVLEKDKANPQIGQISDLGLVELTRHRQGQSLQEIFSKKCPTCGGTGYVIEPFNFTVAPGESEYKAKASKIKLPSIKPQNFNAQPKQQKEEKSKEQDQSVSSEPKQLERKIQTNPSVNANTHQRQNQQLRERKFLLNIDVIKNFIGHYGAPMPLAYIIKSARIPLMTLNTRFPQWLVRDTFMMLNEIENANNEPVAEIPNKEENISITTKKDNSQQNTNEEKEQQLSLINKTENTSAPKEDEPTKPKKGRKSKPSQPKKSTGRKAGRPKKAKE